MSSSALLSLFPLFHQTFLDFRQAMRQKNIENLGKDLKAVFKFHSQGNPHFYFKEIESEDVIFNPRRSVPLGKGGYGTLFQRPDKLLKVKKTFHRGGTLFWIWLGSIKRCIEGIFAICKKLSGSDF